tara:strand:+ start:300 stop:530 length:231 start_codon:yes stop_codon:yes gene_type:complete
MSIDCLADRLSKLRKLRESLCEKEKTWQEAFAARDWIVDQLNTLKSMASDDETTKEEIKERIADILCVLDPGDENE